MSTDSAFNSFGRLPAEIRVMIYRANDKSSLIQLIGANRQIRREVLDCLYGEMSLIGEAEDVHRKLRKILLAPGATGRLRSIPSAIRILTISIRHSTFRSWDLFGSVWDTSFPPSLASNMVAVVGDAMSLQVLTLDLLSFDSANLRKLEIYATGGFLPETLRSLRLYGNDRSISAVMKGLSKHQLQSLALLGLSSYSFLGTLLEGQRVLEFELGSTAQGGVLADLLAACSVPAFLKTESLSLTLHGDHHLLSNQLRDCLGRLKYLSIVGQGLRNDAEVTRLASLYFRKLKNLKYLVIKFDYPVAVMVQRILGTKILARTVHALDEIAWPMLSRVTGEYPGSRA